MCRTLSANASIDQSIIPSKSKTRVLSCIDYLKDYCTLNIFLGFQEHIRERRDEKEGILMTLNLSPFYCEETRGRLKEIFDNRDYLSPRTSILYRSIVCKDTTRHLFRQFHNFCFYCNMPIVLDRRRKGRERKTWRTTLFLKRSRRRAKNSSDLRIMTNRIYRESLPPGCSDGN